MLNKFVQPAILLTLFTVFLFLGGCDKIGTYEGPDGFLEGTIRIGPLCPVERIPPDPACQPTAETYKAWPVSVLTPDGRIRITRISPALSGKYSVELIPGNYLIVLERSQNTIGSSNLPREITILPADSTRLDINIDTGIR